MRALIAGASGAIGRALVHRLRANQHEVFALTQSRDSAAVLTEIGAEPVTALLRPGIRSTFVRSYDAYATSTSFA
jgi:nucleoside-diphosphate-sugar epimerase